MPLQVFSLDVLVWPRKLERELQLDGGARHWQTQSPGVYIRRETDIALEQGLVLLALFVVKDGVWLCQCQYFPLSILDANNDLFS